MNKQLLSLPSALNSVSFGESLQQEMQSWVQDIELVEQKMIQVCAEPADNKILLQALRRHLQAGGSRSRCKIALTSAYALGLPREDAVAIATGVELLHNASLVQDDLQDLSTLRRGQPTIWKSFGTNTALGLTDLMITGTFAAVADVSQSHELAALIKQIHRVVGHTLYGQAYDLGQYGVEQLAPELCLEVARTKSGPLFALGLELPLIAAGYHDHLKYARGAANAMGLGYQIVDDIADRDQDAEQRSIANVVLALELEHDPKSARVAAAKIAREYLELASIMGKQLPNQCGYLLQEFATQLLARLQEVENA